MLRWPPPSCPLELLQQLKGALLPTSSAATTVEKVAVTAEMKVGGVVMVDVSPGLSWYGIIGCGDHTTPQVYECNPSCFLPLARFP
jgi:hypothetical protein